MEHIVAGKFDNNYYFSKDVDRRYSQSTQHYHPHYEIYFMKEGKCKYFIDDRVYEVESGDIIFIPKGLIHRTNYQTPTHTRLLINFTDEYMTPLLKDYLDDYGYLYRSREITRYAEKFFLQIEHEYTHPDEFTTTALKSYTAELICLMLRHPGAKDEEATTGNDLVDGVVKYIKQNYMTDIRLSSVAKMRAVSPEHLSRTFKSCTGLGFNEYVTILRLKKAEDMLQNDRNMTVSEIAYECGFNDGNYFSYKFKKLFGVSPLKARELYKK